MKYDVRFNYKKNQFFNYKCKRACPADGVLINNVKVIQFNDVIHLGNCLLEARSLCAH